MSNSSSSTNVTVTVKLTDPQALALANLAKRFMFADTQGLAANRGEANLMLEAVERLQRALTDVGYPPR